VLYGERVRGFEISEVCTRERESLTKGIDATRFKTVSSGAAGADWVSVAIVEWLLEGEIAEWLVGGFVAPFIQNG
jgi:hypothetical protein